MASVKGKLFEFFVCRMLISCGFKQVIPDGSLVFDGTAGTMVQGLGQAHNADVLLEPPFQMPFYFPTRLLVECKCYNDTVGLPVVRNALGLREDINNFDIVTEDILRNRRLVYTTKSTYYPMRRYNYQVAVASMSGFKSTAIPFSQAHRIPLISFAESTLFEEVRRYIMEIEKEAINDEDFAESVLQYLKVHQYEYYYDICGSKWNYAVNEFIRTVRHFQERIVIGLLEDGTIIFLVKKDGNYNVREKRYKDGCEIHWSEVSRAWELSDEDEEYSFELPKEIYRKWIDAAEERCRAAIRIKKDYFSKIVLFEGRREEVRVIRLSEKFIQDAKRNLDME